MIRLRITLATLALLAMPATAQAGENAVKVGVLTDMNGFSSGTGGSGSVTAAQLAIEKQRLALILRRH